MFRRALLAASSFVLLALACGGSDEPRRGGAGGWRTGPEVPVDGQLEGRFEAYAVSAGDRLYFLGGIVGTGTDIASASPTAMVSVLARDGSRWEEGPSLPEASAKHHLSVAVVGGEIYVLGGFDGIIGRGVPNETFRPVGAAFVLRGGAWQRIADAPLARGGATAQAIGGKIYVAGGAPTEGVPPLAEVWELEPRLGTWRARAPLPRPREHVASCVIEGKMLVIGGWVGPGNVASAAVDAYDPATDTWSTWPDLPRARGGLAAVTIDGTCHVLGGEDWALPPPGTFALHDAFDTRARTWLPKAPLPAALHGIGVAVHGNEIWLVGGGPIQGNSYTRAVSIFSP